MIVLCIFQLTFLQNNKLYFLARSWKWVWEKWSEKCVQGVSEDWKLKGNLWELNYKLIEY